jgi:hypothetical protein
MATQGNITPKADQPKVTTESLRSSSQPATLQYRTSSIKGYGNRSTPRQNTRSSGAR